MTKSRIKIVSRLSHEYCNKITVDNVTYEVHTEDKGPSSHEIVSMIYKKGKIIFSRKYDYSKYIKQKDFADKISLLMGKQHKAAIQSFITEQTSHKKVKSEYFEEARKFLKKGDGKSALHVITKALDDFPLDPFFLSYYGCLVAIVKHNYKEGVKICRSAITRLDKTVPFGTEFFYPVFYLNLGRAYLSGNRKVEAIKAFHRGLKNDPKNQELLEELNIMGTRKKPAVRFLHRSNPINKYIGLLLSRATKKG
jgi:tetratricopeptide (TPR) repeat protein